MQPAMEVPEQDVIDLVRLALGQAPPLPTDASICPPGTFQPLGQVIATGGTTIGCDLCPVGTYSSFADTKGGCAACFPGEQRAMLPAASLGHLCRDVSTQLQAGMHP